jgi:hypothetical protein
MTPVHIFTLALDANPFIAALFTNLNRLTIPWTWTIVEGVALPVADTGWMKGQIPRLSRDGTHEFLLDLMHHPRINVISKTQWGGKTEMCNAALPDRECVLLQADADELWTADQITKHVSLFDADPELSIVKVKMRYFLGPNIVSTSQNGYGNRSGEWIRVWRFRPGMKFQKHEPPILGNNRGKMMDKEESVLHIGEVDHYAWATYRQAFYKQQVYGGRYGHAAQQWQTLQAAKMPVTDLASQLPWVGVGGTADTLHKETTCQS